MNLNFIKLNSDSKYIKTIFDILRECGEDMEEKYGLAHWKKPYSIESIKRDCNVSDVYLVLDMSTNIAVATFMISNTASSYFKDTISSYYIKKFAIRPSFEKKGIGFKSLNFIEKKAKEMNVKKLRLDVYVESKNAINFYLKNEFKILYSRPTAHFEVLCMEKNC